AALLQELLSGHDPHDSTSLPDTPSGLVAACHGEAGSWDGAGSDPERPLAGLKVGLVEEMHGEGYAPGVLEAFENAVARMRELGAETVELSCPSFHYSLAAY
ncbi:amidase family protein, partial [Streptococcus anginosus]|nr:amidase family protein [Streptococcus anginosus]